MEKSKRQHNVPGQSKRRQQPGKKIFDFKAWLPYTAVLVLMVLTWYLYKPSLNNHFTNWDDPDYVLENGNVKKLNEQNAAYLFSHSSASNYHPLTMISLSIDYDLTTRDKKLFRETEEPEATIFHTTSLLLHIVNVLLVFIFIYLLSRKRLVVATATALLFAIHPMHVESVSWIAERKDVLYTLFFLAGLIVYLKYLERPGWIKLIFSGILFLASLLSKPAAVVFPLILLTIDYFSERKFTAKVILEKIPFFILSLVFGIVTFMIQAHTAVAGIKVFSLFERVMFSSYGFIMYQFKLLVPLNITAFYPYPSLNASGHLPLNFYLFPVLTLMVFGLVYYSARHTRIFSFGYLLFLACIALVLQFMPVGTAIMADRYSYMSSIGLFFIVGWYLDKAFTVNHKALSMLRWVFAGIFLAYSLFLCKTTYEQTSIWQNSGTLWTDVISKFPQAEISYKQRGNYYGSLNKPDSALQDFLSFIRIKQDDAGVYSNLGNVYGMRGESEKALVSYSKSILLDSLNTKVFLNRAITYTKAKNYPAALLDYQKALKLYPEFLEVYANRNRTFLEMERFQDAIEDLNLLILNNPRNENYYMSRGICHFKLRNFTEALADFQEFSRLSPENGAAFFNASACYNELKDYRQAYQYALKAGSHGFKVDESYLEKLRKKMG